VHALWVVAALLAATLTGIWLIPHDSSRDRVTSYISDANETGRAFALRYRDVTKAYQSFSSAPKAQPAQKARLEQAARRLTELRQQLAAIPAPKEAQPLRARLIAFYRAQEQVAYEIAGVSGYFPQLIAAEKPLAPAAKRMQKEVGAAKTPDAQAAALAAYAAAIGRGARNVQRIDAPPLLVHARDAEAKRLTLTMRRIRGVQQALAAGDRAALQTAVGKLALPNDASVLASRAAILSYDAHVKQIDKLAAKVEAERRRLDRTLD